MIRVVVEDLFNGLVSSISLRGDAELNAQLGLGVVLLQGCGKALVEVWLVTLARADCRNVGHSNVRFGKYNGPLRDAAIISKPTESVRSTDKVERSTIEHNQWRRLVQ